MKYLLGKWQSDWFSIVMNESRLSNRTGHKNHGLCPSVFKSSQQLMEVELNQIFSRMTFERKFAMTFEYRKSITCGNADGWLSVLWYENYVNSKPLEYFNYAFTA